MTQQRKTKRIWSKSFENQILFIFSDICFETAVTVFQSGCQSYGWILLIAESIH